MLDEYSEEAEATGKLLAETLILGRRYLQAHSKKNDNPIRKFRK
jgi:hypothetical protein